MTSTAPKESDPLHIATRWPEAPSQKSSKGEIARLVVVIAAVIAVGYAAGYGETVLLILFLIGCIVAHEFGHFTAAKTGGVKVTEFFVGFGPRLWSIRKGETEYGVKALPLGGYCRIIGMNNLEEVDLEDEARTYRRAPLYRRLLIDIAGSAMHFVIALVVLFAMFFWTGDRGAYLANVPANNPINQILAFNGKTSPAESAGLKVGDRIEAVDGRSFAQWTDMTTFVQAHPGQKLTLSVLRGGRSLTLHATPVAASTVKGAAQDFQLPAGRSAAKVGVLGIGVSGVIHSSFGASLSHAGGAFVSAGASTLDGLGHLVTLHGISSYVHMVSSQKAAQQSSDRLVTVVGLPSVLHQAGQSGLPTVLWVLAVINISIGIINLVPLFPFDGGRVVVGLYEGVVGLFRGRSYRVDIQRLLPIMYAGLAVIAFFALGSIFIDLRNVAS